MNTFAAQVEALFVERVPRIVSLCGKRVHQLVIGQIVETAHLTPSKPTHILTVTLGRPSCQSDQSERSDRRCLLRINRPLIPPLPQHERLHAAVPGVIVPTPWFFKHVVLAL